MLRGESVFERIWRREGLKVSAKQWGTAGLSQVVRTDGVPSKSVAAVGDIRVELRDALASYSLTAPVIAET